jgi:aryl-alcohol dehydrogenase-like predicted oxidoreductase
MVWSPLAGGYPSGKHMDESGGGGRRESFDFPPLDRDRADRNVRAMRGIAEVKQVFVARIALAWLLHQDVVTNVLVGAKRIDQFTDNIAATDVSLDQSDRDALNAVSALSKEHPGWMLEMRQARHN